MQERQKREIDPIGDPVKIQHLLRNYLKGRAMFMKSETIHPPAEVKIVDVNELNNLTLLSPYVDLKKGDEVTLFRILGRYIEVGGEVVERSAQNQYKLVVKKAGIAKKERQTLRMNVPDGAVFITNIRASKSSIDATLFNIPTSVKVNFGQAEQDLKRRFDFVKVDVFNKRGTILDQIRKTGKVLLVENTQDPKSYRPEHPAMFNYADYLDDELPAKMREYLRHKVVSELIVPINYLTHDETMIPLGYFQLQSRQEPFTMDDVIELQGMAFQMVDRIRDSNTTMIKTRQPVMNISRGGIKTRIMDEDLRNYLIRQNGFTFDLFFRGQAPITLYGIIRSTHQGQDGSLTLGVQISGHSSRGGEMKRFNDNIAAQERIVQQKMKKQKEAAEAKPRG